MATPLNKLSTIMLQLWGYDKCVRMAYYVIKTVLGIAGTSKNARLQVLVASLQKLGAQLASYRVLTRFSGIPCTLASGERLPPLSGKSSQDLLCSYIKYYSMLCYYPCEHTAWLVDAGILPLKVNTTPLWRWGCRFWLLYIVVDLWQEIHRIQRDEKALAAAHALQPSSDEEREQRTNDMRRLRAKRHDTVLGLIAKCMDLLMCWHWSMEWSPFSELAIGVMGIVGGSASGYLQWKSL